MENNRKKTIGILSTIGVFMLLLAIEGACLEFQARTNYTEYERRIEKLKIASEKSYLEMMAQKDENKILKETLDKTFTINDTLNRRVKELSAIKDGNAEVSVFNMDIEATAYNLAENIEDGWGGGTATGYDLSDKDWTARVVAVDPSVIPLRQYIYVIFEDEAYQKYNGWWYTADTGGAVKSNVVDFFLGGTTKDVVQSTDYFGRRKAKIIALAKTK